MELLGLAILAVLVRSLVRGTRKRRRHRRLECHRVRILVEAVRHPYDEALPWQLGDPELAEAPFRRLGT